MIWIFMAIATVAAAMAAYLENLWIGGVSLLALVAAIWDGRSQGMWLAYDFDESDGSGSNSSSSSDGGGDGGGD